MLLSRSRAWIASGALLLAIIPSCGTSEDGPVSITAEPNLLTGVAMEIGSAWADYAREHGDPRRFDWQKAVEHSGWDTVRNVARWQFRVEFDHPRRWSGEVFRVTGYYYALVALNDGTCPVLRHRPATIERRGELMWDHCTWVNDDGLKAIQATRWGAKREELWAVGVPDAPLQLDVRDVSLGMVLADLADESGLHFCYENFHPADFREPYHTELFHKRVTLRAGPARVEELLDSLAKASGTFVWGCV
ncbi:MAG: hypothetical protein FJ291_12370 [Planctomycetes bacterium]|nr:hypothetical protein [Planctomycetota bacterium]